ncbi:MAG: hypothetical protein HDT02_02515 [Bacteroidales bacterium]|nr:hypothetical protein [Bacteroidales bacterium]
MEKIEEENIGYQFTPTPTNLMACLDNNCRNMLWTLIQLSSYYADNEGWFFRTNEDLKAQSGLGEKVVRACLSTLYSIGILEVKSVGKGNGKIPNYYRLGCDRFADWEQISLEDCIKNPRYKIETENYKAKDWTPSYLYEMRKEEVEVTERVLSSALSADNIDNIEIRNNNPLYEGTNQRKPNQFEKYKQREDYLMDKLYHATTWTDFKTFRQQINELISTASSKSIAENTRKRFTPIAEGKIKFLKGKISKEPYNSYYDDFYREYDCGWLGKDYKHQINQPQQQSEEENENIVATREILKQYGIDVTNEKEREIADKENITRVPDPSEKKEWDDLPF